MGRLRILRPFQALNPRKWKLSFLLSTKRFLPKHLLGRVLLILFAPLLLVTSITTYVFIDRHWDNVTRRLADDIAGIQALYGVPEPTTICLLGFGAVVSLLGRKRPA